MPKKINIITFWYNDDWGLYGRTYEKMTEHLARLPEVNCVVCLFPPTRPGKWKPRWPLSIREVFKNVWLVKENSFNLTTDHSFYRTRKIINEVLPGWVLKGFLRLIGFRRDNTVLWLFPPHPYLEKIICSVPHTMIVSQVVDDFTKTHQSSLAYQHAREQYPKINQFSDVVITSSQANFDLFKDGHAECYLFGNAVDEIFIGTPSSLPCLEDKSTPRLGYVGWISKRTDLELLESVAKAHPEWLVLIAGPQDGGMLAMEDSALVKLPNVEYLGPLPYNEVPHFLQTLDVCLIPHRDTPYSRSMSPLKLYQYLASGRPIVSTNVAILEEFKQYIMVADNYEQFVKNIKLTLETDTIELSKKRIERAKIETWDKRVRDIFDVVRQKLT